MPAGCKYADAETVDMAGVLNSVSAPGQAGTPAVAAASSPDHVNSEVPDNTTLAASQHGTQLQGTNSSLDGSLAQVHILCRPVPAVRPDAGQSGAAPLQSSGGFHVDISELMWLLLAYTYGVIVGRNTANSQQGHRRGT